jgi:phosphate transport system substrate-binding protein
MIGAQRLGRCLNTGRCGLAGERGPIPIEPGAPFTCPECRNELIAFEGRRRKVEAGKKLRRVPKMLLLPALLLTLLVIIGIRYDLFGFELEQPPLETDGGLMLVTAPSSVRTGAGVVTYDELAPMLWQRFLIAQGCPEVDRSREPTRTIIICTTGTDPKVTISAPLSFVDIGGTAMKTFDLLLTTDPVFADAPHGNLPVKPDQLGNVVHADVIAMDALVVIVHPSNPLHRLSQAQLAGIFLGTTTNFAQLGGQPGRISVVAPAPGAKADDRLDAIVPKWLPLAPRARRLPDSAAIVAAVRQNPLAIGLVEQRAATAIKTLAIGPANGIAVAPTPLALISGDYPLARPVRAIRFNRDDSPYETAFVAFAGTSAGQNIITASGFQPVRADLLRTPFPANAPPAYRALVKGGQRVAANLRFRADSLDFAPGSLAALDAVAARLAGERIAADRINIIGLSDPARSDAGADAAALARQVATLLGTRGIDTATATGLGGAMPLAEAPDGNRNRRVEIWISPAPASTTTTDSQGSAQ